MKDVPTEQAERIFRSCDQKGDGRISLAEFKSTIQRGKEKLKSWEEEEKARKALHQAQSQTQTQGERRFNAVITIAYRIWEFQCLIVDRIGSRLRESICTRSRNLEHPRKHSNYDPELLKDDYKIC